MAPDVRAIADISSIVGEFYDKLMLERLVDRAIVYNLAEKRTIPRGTGNVINFNRFTNFPVVTSKITEGVVPTISYLSGTNISATLFQLGGHCALSDILDWTTFSPLIRDTVANFGDTAATTVDKWILWSCMSLSDTEGPANVTPAEISTWFNAKQGGLSSIFISADGLFISQWSILYNYLSVVANASATDGYRMDLDKLARIAIKLRTNNCRPYSDGFYKAVLNSKQIGSIMRTAEWASWQYYTRPEVLDKGEVGRAHGVRIYESNVIHNSYSGVLSTNTLLCAYFAPVWGQGAFNVTELGGEKGVKTYVKGANMYDTNNPINQWTSVGWKVTMAARALNADCGYFVMTIEA